MNNWCITAMEIAARKIVVIQDCRKWMWSELNITTVSYDFLVVCLIINYLYITLTKWVLDNEVPSGMDLYLKADKICRNHLFHTYNETIWKQKFTVSDLKKEIFYHVNQCYLIYWLHYIWPIMKYNFSVKMLPESVNRILENLWIFKFPYSGMPLCTLALLYLLHVYTAPCFWISGCTSGRNLPWK